MKKKTLPGSIRIILGIFAGTLAILAVCGALTLYVDPFFHYHRPLSWFPYQVDHQLSQNPGMARYMDYDAVITGSSMTVNFDTHDFENALGLNALKLSYDGATTKDISNILEIVYDDKNPARRQNPVRAAFIAVDMQTYTADPEEVKFPLPTYLYDRNPFNDVKYLLNKDVLLDYIAAPLAFHEQATDLSYVYGMDWLTDDMLGLDYIRDHYHPAGRKREEMAPDALLEATRTNIRQNLMPYIQDHPETTFTFFFPPVSLLFWNDVQNENMLRARLAQCEEIGEDLLDCPNVRVFYFQDIEDIVTDFDRYTDSVHYVRDVNSYMVSCFADGSHEVKKGGMHACTERMRRIVESYDFDALHLTRKK